MSEEYTEERREKKNKNKPSRLPLPLSEERERVGDSLRSPVTPAGKEVFFEDFAEENSSFKTFPSQVSPDQPVENEDNTFETSIQSSDSFLPEEFATGVSKLAADIVEAAPVITRVCYVTIPLENELVVPGLGNRQRTKPP